MKSKLPYDLTGLTSEQVETITQWCNQGLTVYGVDRTMGKYDYKFTFASISYRSHPDADWVDVAGPNASIYERITYRLCDWCMPFKSIWDHLNKKS